MRDVPFRPTSRLSIPLALMLLLPAWAPAQDIAAPVTRSGYAAYKKAQSDASDEAYRRGDIDRVREIEQASLDTARRFGDRDEEAASIHGLALADLAAGQLDAAERRFRESIDLVKQSGDRKILAAAMRGLGRVLEARGRLAEATEVQVAALELLLRHGSPMGQSESYYSLAKLFLSMQDYPAAMHGVDRAIALMGAAPPDFPLGLNLALRSTIERELGETPAALADAQAAQAAFARADSRIGAGIAELALGAALAAGGKPEQGLQRLQAGLAIARELKEATLEADLLLQTGVVLDAQGRHEEALPALRRALGIAEQSGLDNMRRDINVELEKACSALGRTAEALAASKEAFAAQTRIAGLSKIGRMAGRSAESQLAALNSRFMALDPATSAGPQVLKPEPPAHRRGWWWLLAVAALAAALGLAVRQARRLRNQSEQLRRQISVDPLTGAMSRRAFSDALAAMLGAASARAEAVSLMVFDLDHFKAVNDRHGHMTGDAALKLLAGLVREQLDSDDLFGRFGGDEFLVAGRRSPAAMREIAERIRAAVEGRSRITDAGLPPLSISAGLAHADPGVGYDAEALFARADAALYIAKQSGRNRVAASDDAAPNGGDQRFLSEPDPAAAS